MKGIWSLTVLWIFMLSGAAAQGAQMVERGDLIAQWKVALREIDHELASGEFSRAQREASRLADEMAQEMGVGGGSAYTLALACAFRAIAESGLGHDDDALWHWRVANALDPTIEKVDLSSYGAPAARLRDTPFRSKFQSTASMDPEVKKRVQPPVVKKKPMPRYPENMRRMKVQTAYAFDVVIDENGHVEEPLVLKPVQEPGFVYVVLESVRKWVFQPAMLDGKPMAVRYTLTVDFKVKD
ncbi:MAG TPA: energy transducer TonB [Thermoanaerobaculia bacterium]|nr:energy transducer TonB [Thermoanaerobaculia bacterium]